MAVYGEARGIAAEAEPFGLLTEGAAGIATIVLGVIALAGISAGLLTSIITIIIGVGLLVQAFNAGAEASRELNASGAAIAARGAELGGEVMINVAADHALQKPDRSRVTHGGRTTGLPASLRALMLPACLSSATEVRLRCVPPRIRGKLRGGLTAPITGYRK